MFDIILSTAVPSQRFAIPYAKALGGPEFPLVRAHEGGWPQDLWL